MRLDWRERTRALTDVVFPRACMGCGGAPGRMPGYLCWECFRALPFLHAPLCAVCGRPLATPADGAVVCAQCDGRRRAFNRARAAVRFLGAVKTAVHTFKYGGGVWLLRDLGELMAAAVRVYYAGARFDAVTWVPLDRTRLRTRGYNQAALLARYCATRAGLPRPRPCLARTRTTASQTQLTASERAANVKGAFATTRRAAVAGRYVLLVDDVMTTGATVSECARACRRAGARAVDVLAVAHG